MTGQSYDSGELWQSAISLLNQLRHKEFILAISDYTSICSSKFTDPMFLTALQDFDSQCFNFHINLCRLVFDSVGSGDEVLKLIQPLALAYFNCRVAPILEISLKAAGDLKLQKLRGDESVALRSSIRNAKNFVKMKANEDGDEVSDCAMSSNSDVSVLQSPLERDLPLETAQIYEMLLNGTSEPAYIPDTLPCASNQEEIDMVYVDNTDQCSTTGDDCLVSFDVPPESQEQIIIDSVDAEGTRPVDAESDTQPALADTFLIVEETIQAGSTETDSFIQEDVNQDTDSKISSQTIAPIEMHDANTPPVAIVDSTSVVAESLKLDQEIVPQHPQINSGTDLQQELSSADFLHSTAECVVQEEEVSTNSDSRLSSQPVASTETDIPDTLPVATADPESITTELVKLDPEVVAQQPLIDSGAVSQSELSSADTLRRSSERMSKRNSREISLSSSSTDTDIATEKEANTRPKRAGRSYVTDPLASRSREDNEPDPSFKKRTGRVQGLKTKARKLPSQEHEQEESTQEILDTIVVSIPRRKPRRARTYSTVVGEFMNLN